MKSVMIAAMGSGSGKTIVTAGLLMALKKRNITVKSFKCGPDYIDPMFHTRVLGVPCRNLDLFLMGERGVLREISGARDELSLGMKGRSKRKTAKESELPENASGASEVERSLAVIEGAMGFYDGIGGTTEASAYDVARLLGTPVILVVRSRGQSATLAAQIRGLMSFRSGNHIAGVILNECSAGLFDHLRRIIESECGIPVFGYLPKMEEARIESRHLGLLMADEIPAFKDRFETIAVRMEETMEIDRILACAGISENKTVREQKSGMVYSSRKLSEQEPASMACETAERITSKEPLCNSTPGERKLSEDVYRIAIARDEAFSFYYETSLDALRRAGVVLVPFSPLHDYGLPADISGLYLGGGYPENYAAELSANKAMLGSIRKAIEKGLPTVAECGGFMYLQEKLESTGGISYPMVEALPGEALKTPRIVRFGYVTLSTDRNSMLFRTGETVPAHEFHHWDSTVCGDGLTARKYDGRSWKCGMVSDRLYAGYPHLELGGDAPLAERFVQTCREYGGTEGCKE